MLEEGNHRPVRWSFARVSSPVVVRPTARWIVELGLWECPSGQSRTPHDGRRGSLPPLRVTGEPRPRVEGHVPEARARFDRSTSVLACRPSSRSWEGGPARKRAGRRCRSRSAASWSKEALVHPPTKEKDDGRGRGPSPKHKPLARARGGRTGVAPSDHGGEVVGSMRDRATFPSRKRGPEGISAGSPNEGRRLGSGSPPLFTKGRQNRSRRSWTCPCSRKTRAARRESGIATEASEARPPRDCGIRSSDQGEEKAPRILPRPAEAYLTS